MEKSKKIRIVTSGIVLSLIVGGWIFYGVNTYKASKSVILKKVAKEIENDVDDHLNDLNFNSKGSLSYNYKINDVDKVIGIYSNIDNNELYLFNDKEYYDITEELNNLNITLKANNLFNKNYYKTLVKDVLDAVKKNEQNIVMTRKVDTDERKYIYSYSIDSLSPIIESLKTNQEFINTLNETYQTKTEDTLKILNKMNGKRLSLSTFVTGKKYDIVSYSIKIDNLLTLKVSDDFISGFFMDVGFFYDNALTLLTEDYQLDLTKNENVVFDKNTLSKKDILNLEELIGVA